MLGVSRKNIDIDDETDNFLRTKDVSVKGEDFLAKIRLDLSMRICVRFVLICVSKMG